MEDKKNNKKGFFKGIGIGILISVLSMGILSGCRRIDLDSFINESLNKDSSNAAGKDSSDDADNKDNSDDKEAVYGEYKPKSDIINDELIEKMDTLIQVVDYYYLYDYDEEAMAEAIYAGILNSLGDPYSVYYTEEEYDSFLEGVSGTYCGIGVVVQQNIETGIVTAVKPYAGCPGDKAGILPGDTILAVEGTEITGMDLNSAVTLIKGEEGTPVTLTIKRGTEVFDVTAVREMIDVETVTHKMLDNNIGYIDVDEFGDKTAKQFSKAFDDLEAQNMTGLVIDLRDNPGGVLDIVVEMLDSILPEGTIVSVKDKYGATDVSESDAATRLNVPLVVLVNENSASASEIFAGAVKDYGVGTIVGKTTFGKGIVQTIFGLQDGTGVKVTIEDYYTPKGESIHKIGVSPDVEIDLPDEVKMQVTIPYEEDIQLQKAVEILTK